jgi:uncharacterized protein (TIGR02145 family)
LDIYNVWDNLPNQSTGKDFTKDLLLPPAGYRYSNDLNFYYLGDDGYYWSSTPYDKNNAYRLDFYSPSYIRPQYADSVSIGLSVRCFKDEYESSCPS